MYRAVALVFGLAIPLAAQAQTYVATFQSGPLAPNPGFKGIKGATHLTLTLYSKKPFAAGFCCSWTGKYDFSDGKDTLKSLIAKGYTVQNGYPYVDFGTDGNGNITSWYIRMNMPSSLTGRPNYYGFVGNYNFQGNMNEMDVAFSYNGVATAWDTTNTTLPGTITTK